MIDSVRVLSMGQIYLKIISFGCETCTIFEQIIIIKSEPQSNGQEGVSHTPQIPRTGATPSDAV